MLPWWELESLNDIETARDRFRARLLVASPAPFPLSEHLECRYGIFKFQGLWNAFALWYSALACNGEAPKHRTTTMLCS